MADEQLLAFETEFTIENWQVQLKGITDEMEELGQASGDSQKVASAARWRLADCLLYGYENFKDELKIEREAQKANKSLGRRTVWDYIRTAKAFPESRRRDSLSWSHHKEIATAQFSAEQRDRLLVQAETKKLSVTGLRTAAERIAKVISKPTREEKAWKKISLVFIPANFDAISRLANARKVERRKLLTDIVISYFRSNKDNFLKEIEEYEAPIKAAQQASREAKQQARRNEKAREAELLKEPNRAALKKYFDWLGREVQGADYFLRAYFRRECGTDKVIGIPIAAIEAFFVKIGEQRDPHTTLQVLTEMARYKPSSL